VRGGGGGSSFFRALSSLAAAAARMSKQWQFLKACKSWVAESFSWSGKGMIVPNITLLDH
jgi:hypothetical protein